jgi:FMN phosphatase YigB (HAD superfamily)
MINISGHNISTVLFDLDNTLVDRDRAVERLGCQLYQSVEYEESGLGEPEWAQEFIRIDAGGSIPDK